MKSRIALLGGLALAALPTAASADRVVFADGRVLEHAFVRDEGTHYAYWETLADVGRPPKVVPRSAVKEVVVERGDDWDARPKLPDLAVTFIEMTPKLPGLHRRVEYDGLGTPFLTGALSFADVGDRAYLEPEAVAAAVKFLYAPGEEVTLTAHVKNSGFATASGFGHSWAIDGKVVERGALEGLVGEMDEVTFSLKWKWQEGPHTVTFRIETDQAQIATTNDEATDPLWGWGLVFVVHPERVKAWHQHRTAYGTFSFEDFYRWHVDLMNALFEKSVYPSAPEGIRARVRLDRILYSENPEWTAGALLPEGGLREDQGMWVWWGDEDRNRKWDPPTKEWRNQTEWSLPHELGHQLGLTDLYRFDDAGSPAHAFADNRANVAHFMRRPRSMMHWHGPNLWSEIDAGALNQGWDKPRGWFGDHHFAIPAEVFLEVVDVNGRPVPDALVEVFQRGVEVDPNAPGGEEAGVKWFGVAEDGDFEKPVSTLPVIVGRTDRDGRMRLPNRPVVEARTLNGFHRRPNPFGNLNVVGQRGLLLVRVTKFERPCPFWLEVTELNTAWFRGARDRATVSLKTPYRSDDSPRPPREVTAARLEGEKAKVTWAPPDSVREQHYLDTPIGYRVWRRHSSDGLNDRPWFVVATLGKDAREFVADLKELPDEVYWFSRTERFAVSSVGELGTDSELVEVLLPNKP